MDCYLPSEFFLSSFLSFPKPSIRGVWTTFLKLHILISFLVKKVIFYDNLFIHLLQAIYLFWGKTCLAVHHAILAYTGVCVFLLSFVVIYYGIFIFKHTCTIKEQIII